MACSLVPCCAVALVVLSCGGGGCAVRRVRFRVLLCVSVYCESPEIPTISCGDASMRVLEARVHVDGKLAVLQHFDLSLKRGSEA